MKILREEVKNCKLANGFFGLADQFYTQMLNITTDEIEYMCEVGGW